MSRIKTIVFWLFLLLFLIAGVWAYINLKNSKKPKVEAISVMPDNCLVYLNSSHFFDLNKKLNSQSLIADKLKLFIEVNSLCTTIHTFDSLFNSYKLLHDEIEDNVIHFGLYNTKQDWLIAFNIKQLGSQPATIEALLKIFNAKKIKDDVYQFEINKNKNYCFHLNEGVALISNDKALIAQALNKATPKLQNSKSFKEFKSTLTENNLLSIYVNHNLYGANKSATQLNLSQLCRKGFSAGAIDLQPSELKINGYLDPDSSEVLSAFQNQQPQSHEDFLSLLPLNTVSFESYGFESFSEIRKNIRESNPNFWKIANEKALYNIQADFYTNIENHLVDFSTVPSRDHVITVSVSDTVKAIEHLKILADSTILRDSTLIYQIQNQSSAFKMFAPFFNRNTNYVAYYNSHLFFSENPTALTEVLVSLKSNLLITANESFVSYKNQYFIDDYNYLAYMAPNQCLNSIPSFFNYKKVSNEDPFQNFKHFSFSVTNNTEHFKFRFHLLNETRTLDEDHSILWTLRLDSASTMKANGFVNHITKENELVIQDGAKNLYLINAKGTVLWKKKLSEEIMSSIYTVDIFKNNKYQLLFNTKNYLHLVDRNGNYVKGYPVKLPAEATSELSLFDYDSDKDYRLFIACKNNSIYNFNIYGIKQEGFVTVKTDDEVNLPLQYVKVGLSDYLVALDKEGKIYTFSRRGVGRIGLRNRTVANCSAFYVDASPAIANTHLVYLDDRSGMLNLISFEDKKELVKLRTDIENSSIAFSLFDNNRSMDFILSKSNSIMVYNFSGNLIEEKTTDLNLGEINFYTDENQSLFYALSEERKELVLIDRLKQKTKIVKATAMPLISNLFNDNKKYMLITNGVQLNCMLLN